MTRAFVTQKALSRRTILRGIGATVALPLLDSMVPALKSAPAPVSRAAFLYTANGIIMKDWTPSTEGEGFEFTRTLKPLEPFRDRVLVLDGPGASQRGIAGRRRGRSRARGRQLAQRGPSQKDRRRGHPQRHHGGSDSGEGNRRSDAAALPGTGPGRRPHGGWMRLGLQLRVLQHHFLELAHHAHTLRNQS